MITLRKASEGDIRKILAKNHIEEVSAERMTMCKIGCQLGYLYPDDIVYIADSSTSYGDATRRLATRRKAYI